MLCLPTTATIAALRKLRVYVFYFLENTAAQLHLGGDQGNVQYHLLFICVSSIATLHDS